MTFVDTSAPLALINVADQDHSRVSVVLRRSDGLVTHNYVIVETEALVRRRLGAVPSRRFLDRIDVIAEVRRVDRALHDRAVARLEPHGRRASLVPACRPDATASSFAARAGFIPTSSRSYTRAASRW